MRLFTFLTLLFIVESVYSHSSNFLSHARRSMDIIKRQEGLGGLLGLGGDSPSSPSPSKGGLLGGIVGGNPSPTAKAPAASPPAASPAAASSPAATSPSDGLGDVVDGLLSPAAPVVTALAPVVNPVKSIVKPVASAAAPVLKPLDPVVKPVATLVSEVAKPVGTIVAPVVTAVATVVKPVASGIAPVVSVVASGAAPVLSGAASAAAPILSGAASAAAPVLSGAVSAAAPVLSGAVSAAAPVLSGAVSAAAPVLSGAVSAAAPILSGAASAAAPILSGAASAAAPILSGAASAAAPVITVLTSAAAPVFTALTPVISAVPSLPPVASVIPSLPPIVSVVPSLPPIVSVVPSLPPVVSVITSAIAPFTTSILPFIPPPETPTITVSTNVPDIPSAAPAVTNTLPLPNSGTPTIPPPETPTITFPSTSIAPLISVISFPRPSATTVPTITTNSPQAKMTTMSIDSKISFILTISSLALNSIPTVTNSLTNPDQASSTVSAVPTGLLPLPSGMPARIYPPTRLDPNTDLTGFTFIAILFDLELNWPFVVLSPISSTQIFAYIPIIIATALGIQGTQILTWALQVYIPTTYQTPADADQLGTLWLGYVPTNLVTTLSQEILAKQSKFYTGESDAVARALAGHVNSGFDILSVSDPNPGGPSSGDGGKSRRDAIIGVVSSLGGIAFFVLVFLAYRMMKNRRDHAHRRLSDPSDSGSAGIRPEGQDFDQDSVGGARRRSFYYAEDSLRGFQDAEPEQIGGPPVMSERRTVAPGTPISAPVLQENSLNW